MQEDREQDKPARSFTYCSLRVSGAQHTSEQASARWASEQGGEALDTSPAAVLKSDTRGVLGPLVQRLPMQVLEEAGSA